MLSANDKAIPILYRAVLVICVFMVFGMVLNGVVTRKDRIFEERNHQTEIRISLIREEYERKISNLRQKYKNTCEKTIQEVAFNLRQTARKTIEADRVQLEEFYKKKLKNQSDEIELLKKSLQRISDNAVGIKGKDKDNLSAIEDIEKHLSDLKSRILNGLSAKNNNVLDSAERQDKFSAEERKIFSKVTERLEQLEKEVGGV